MGRVVTWCHLMNRRVCVCVCVCVRVCMRERERERETHTHTHTHRKREREREREREGERERGREREREREREERERGREGGRERERERERDFLFGGCLMSQQHASLSQERICSDNFMCCHTEIEVADQTFYLTQSQYTDTGPTSPSADPITPGAWQGSYWSANF